MDWVHRIDMCKYTCALYPPGIGIVDVMIGIVSCHAHGMHFKHASKVAKFLKIGTILNMLLKVQS